VPWQRARAGHGRIPAVREEMEQMFPISTRPVTVLLLYAGYAGGRVESGLVRSARGELGRAGGGRAFSSGRSGRGVRAGGAEKAAKGCGHTSESAKRNEQGGEAARRRAVVGRGCRRSAGFTPGG